MSRWAVRGTVKRVSRPPAQGPAEPVPHLLVGEVGQEEGVVEELIFLAKVGGERHRVVRADADGDGSEVVERVGAGGAARGGGGSGR